MILGMSFFPKNKGFTLIELLVVVAIVGLLASVVLVSMKGARAKARDARRLQDMHQIILALQLHYDKYERYPDPCGDGGGYGECEGVCGGWDTSTVDNDGDGKPFIESLVDEKLISVPGDPIGGGTCGGFTYRYHRYNCTNGGSSYPCYGCTRPFFVLGINDIETSGRPYPDSPSWSCPSRNWQGEFDWVTGDFEW